MPRFILTDTARNVWTDSWSLGPGDMGHGHAGESWSIHKRTLRGGRRDGVDVVEVNNGALQFTVVPTRGMGLWRGNYRGDRLGWDSPVSDGPVNPAFVNLAGLGGLGFLDGFDEVMVRCGLEQNGPPYHDGNLAYPLHGRIANIPAHFVEVSLDEPPHTLVVEGLVDESRLFFPRLRLASRMATAIGSNRLVVHDRVTNLGEAPTDIELLYHWNFGPPYLEEGARLEAPARVVVPRDDRAAQGIDSYPVYAAPEVGYAEQVYYFELLGEGPEANTLTLLRNKAGDKGICLRFSARQLPRFIQWKCTRGVSEGYVTGLEPATNYPNPRPREAERGRLVQLEPGETYTAETTLEVLQGANEVQKVSQEIQKLQSKAAPKIHHRPTEPYCPIG